MLKAMIIHGAHGSPEENWFPWLRHELEKLGYEVFVPQFPVGEEQNLENWMAVFEKYKKCLGDDSIIIGHSIGATFILSVLESTRARATFLVAGFLGQLGLSLDPINKTFSEKSFNWDKIRVNCKKFFVYASDDDSYVPLERGQQIAEKLGTKLTIISNAGHFNAKAGFLKFDLLLKDVLKL